MNGANKQPVNLSLSNRLDFAGDSVNAVSSNNYVEVCLWHLKSSVRIVVDSMCIKPGFMPVSVKESKEIQKRLREIDDARNDYISLIAAGTMDEESMDEQFQKLYTEEQELNSKLKALEESNNIENNKRFRITQALQKIDSSSCELTEYNDMLVRKLVECIKVNSKTEITIIYKGGIESTVEVEK